MALPVPYDRLIAQQFNFPHDRPPCIPNITVVPPVSQAMPFIASAAANEITQSAMQTPARVFAFNLCSSNNWNNQDYAEAVEILLAMFTVAAAGTNFTRIDFNSIPNLAQQAIGVFVSTKIQAYPELRSILPYDVQDAAMQNLTVLNGLMNQYRGIIHSSQASNGYNNNYPNNGYPNNNNNQNNYARDYRGNNGYPNNNIQNNQQREFGRNLNNNTTNVGFGTGNSGSAPVKTNGNRWNKQINKVEERVVETTQVVGLEQWAEANYNTGLTLEKDQTSHEFSKTGSVVTATPILEPGANVLITLGNNKKITLGNRLSALSADIDIVNNEHTENENATLVNVDTSLENIVKTLREDLASKVHNNKHPVFTSTRAIVVKPIVSSSEEFISIINDIITQSNFKDTLSTIKKYITMIQDNEVGDVNQYDLIMAIDNIDVYYSNVLRTILQKALAQHTYDFTSFIEDYDTIRSNDLIKMGDSRIFQFTVLEEEFFKAQTNAVENYSENIKFAILETTDGEGSEPFATAIPEVYNLAVLDLHSKEFKYKFSKVVTDITENNAQLFKLNEGMDVINSASGVNALANVFVTVDNKYIYSVPTAKGILYRMCSELATSWM